MAVERALNMILYPQLIKELKKRLLDEAREHVIKVRELFALEIPLMSSFTEPSVLPAVVNRQSFGSLPPRY